MTIANRLARVARCAPFVFFSACTGDIYNAGAAGSPSVEEQALVSTTANPPTRTTVSGAMPSLFPDRADSRLGIFNLASELTKAPSGSNTNWPTAAIGDSHKTSAAFATQLNSALAEGRAERQRREDDWDTVIDAVEQLAEYYGVEIDAGQDVDMLFGFPTERGRWLDRENNTSFVDPAGMAELRQRGARLYCAAKEAFEHGGGESQIMGRKSLASLNVVGQRIDFFTVEPTVALGAPKKFMSQSNDGGQAFNIPLSVGVRLSPLSLLPTLPELRTPVTMITADSETISRANVNASTTQFWQTVTHADAFMSSRRAGHIRPDEPITLFTIGPVEVQMDMDLGIHNQACSQASGIDGCRNTSWVPASRLMDLNGAELPDERVGMTSGTVDGITYNDEYWTRSANYQTGYIGGDVTQSVPLGFQTPLYWRASINDDKQVQVRTGIEAQLELFAGAAYSAGPLYIAVSAGGRMVGQVDVVHSVREQLYASGRPDPDDEFLQPMWRPETGLSVTPSTEASMVLSMFAEIVIELEVPLLDTLVIREDVITPHADVATHYGDGWPESSRLRLGTMTSTTPATELRSHWPAATGAASSFQALPDSIPTCVAEASPTGDLSEPCDSVRGTYPGARLTPPRAEMCVVALNLAADWDRSRPDERCLIALAGFAASGASRPFGTNQRSRAIRENNLTDGDAFRAAMSECARGGLSQDEINALVQIDLCSTTGLGFTNPIDLTAGTNDQPTLTPNACSAD